MSDQTPELPENSEAPDEIISLQGMYQDYFLDYASYVILERAVPALEDGWIKTRSTKDFACHERNG